MVGPYNPVMRFFMSTTRPAAIAALAALLAAGPALLPATLPAGAQTLPPDHPPVPPQPKAAPDRVTPDPAPEPPKRGIDRVPAERAAPDLELPQVGEAPDVTIDQLFDRLKKAKRPEQGKRIAREIEMRWLASGSDTIDLLMARSISAMKANEMVLALDLLDAVITLKPDYAEAWNKRATVHFARKNLGASVADIEAALRLEPRHFGALFGLATLMKEFGDKKGALAAYRRALELNPYLPDVEKTMKELTLEVEGREL